MMLTATGYSCRIRKKTTNWRSVVLCIVILMHKINCNDLSCMNTNCDEKEIEVLIQEKRLNFQQREYELIQKQKEIHHQLQKLYSEQHKLELMLTDEPNEESDVLSGIEYEIPSYCANCLGNTFEPSSKATLSSEYSRKNAEVSAVNSQEDIQSHLTDHRRLEAIKFQILLKLGLKNKPNVTNSLSKQFIFDTLQRSGENALNDYTLMVDSSDKTDAQVLISEESRIHNQNKTDNTLSQPDEEQDFDDFYGRTREIISFADKGKINKFNLRNFLYTTWCIVL